MTVDKSEHRIRQMFGEIAGRYDFMNHLLSGGVDCYWRWRTVRAAPIVDAVPILDVCTGTGDLALAWWRRGGRKAPVIGSDFTHAMLVLANQKLSGRSAPVKIDAVDIPRPRFVEADTQYLPFADDSFQLVSVAFGLRNVTDTRRGLREMLRVCRPGGYVLVLEFSTPRNRLFSAIYHWYFRHILPRIGQLVARNQQSAYNYLPQSVSEFPDGDALADIMRDCGMIDVDWRPLTFGIATLYCGRKPTKPAMPTGPESNR